MPERPTLRMVREGDDDDVRPVMRVRDLERSILDLAQDVAATMSLADGDSGACTGDAVRQLCDAVHDLNATIVSQGSPSAIPMHSGYPGA